MAEEDDDIARMRFWVSQWGLGLLGGVLIIVPLVVIKTATGGSPGISAIYLTGVVLVLGAITLRMRRKKRR